MSLASFAFPLTRLLRPRASPSLLVNPAYAAALDRAGLIQPEDFLRLPETIVSGHPGRQVSRVVLGNGPETIPAFLKREHRVPWKDRLANAWAGFGFVSKSYREARLLAAVRQAGDARLLVAGDPAESVTWNVSAVEAATSGRPLRMPVDASRAAQVGSVPAVRAQV